MISAEHPNWERETPHTFWSPSKKLLKSIRDYQSYRSSFFVKKIFKLLSILRYRFWSVITGADIPINANIAGGLLIPHPNGIVIHHKAKIGPNCLIHQQVTIGVKAYRNDAPIIGGHVDIGAGAKILGNIQVGDHAIIGANAVVTKDVPAYAIVVGIPARIIGSTRENMEGV